MRGAFIATTQNLAVTAACTLHKERTQGDIAQLARAPALQAGGPGFESLYLHQDEVLM